MFGIFGSVTSVLGIFSEGLGEGYRLLENIIYNMLDRLIW